MDVPGIHAVSHAIAPLVPSTSRAGSVWRDCLHPPWSLAQFVKQRIDFFQIGRVETLGERSVNGAEKFARFGTAALVTAETGEAHDSTQIPRASTAAF